MKKEELNDLLESSMLKLGKCTITLEQHTYDATMYGIKDLDPRAPPPPLPQQPIHRPIIQYGPPNGMMPPQPKQF
jgi:hypothetical protein